MIFPYEDPIDIGALLELDDLKLEAARILELLEGHITERRRARIDAVIAERTYTVVPVMDQIYDTGNVAAVLRTSEGLGYAAAAVIESAEQKSSQRITQGADKWVDIARFSTPAECIDDLKSRNFQIVATHLEASVPLHTIDFTRPTAIVFGNERDGVCEEVLDASDYRCVIPMLGFVQSFNISVAAAISLHHILLLRTARLGAQGDLSEAQQRILKAVYYLKAVNEGHRLIPRLLDQ
ncbi:MAG: TrmH family RNA methyltransferase [Bradymonadaceae bacterium]